jgi:predicted amidohydrolase YtcJ
MNSTSTCPDIILFNGTIATQNVQQPAAQAMAIAQDNILAVGSSDDILNLAGSGTEKIDLGRSPGGAGVYRHPHPLL